MKIKTLVLATLTTSLAFRMFMPAASAEDCHVGALDTDAPCLVRCITHHPGGVLALPFECQFHIGCEDPQCL